MTLWFVVGTAAELIKVYPVMKMAEDRGWKYFVLSTGQSGPNFWRQFKDFSLPSNLAFRVQQKDADLSRSFAALKWFLKAVTHDISGLPITNQGNEQKVVVVHGDTLSTLVGSVYAWRLQLPLVHIEAGLRSKSLWQPFPEEITRRLVSKIATIHMAPDDKATENLRASGARGLIVNTQGNSLYDAVHMIMGEAKPALSARPICLFNIHRFENLRSKSRWEIILNTVLTAAQRYEAWFVMHPQTEHKIDNEGLRQRLVAANVKLVPRLPFSEFIRLLDQARLVISDGGSNQEECFYLGKPCLLLRETTERQEGLGSTCVLSNFDVKMINSFIEDPSPFLRPALKASLSPSQTIIQRIGEAFNQ